MSRETPFEQVTAVLPEPIRSGCLALPQPVWERCQEIRLTSGQPVSLYGEGRLRFLGEGALLDEPQGALCATAAQVRSCVQACCEYSLYSHQDQIAQGFLTIRGGHRVGLCGKRFYSLETGETVHEFEAVNLRIARGALPADPAVLRFYRLHGLGNTLIVGPPGSGKTTLLRGLIRAFSGGGWERYLKVGVVDERGELANCLGGQCQTDLGPGAFVQSYFSKAEGIFRCVRTMSPDLVACDEIGNEEDVAALRRCAVSGVWVIATAHGDTVEDLRRNPALAPLLKQGFFTHFLQVSPHDFSVRARCERGAARG